MGDSTFRHGLVAALCVWIVSIRAEDFVGWKGETYDPVKTWSEDGVVFHERTGVIEEELKISKTAPEGGDAEISKRDSTEAATAQGDVLRDTATQMTSTREEWIEQLSWRPRAFLFHSFLTSEECDHIITVARPYVHRWATSWSKRIFAQVRRSTVVSEDGEDVVGTIRTSYGVFIPWDPVVTHTAMMCALRRRLFDDVMTRVGKRVSRWTHIPFSHQEDVNVLRYAESQKYGAHSDVIDEPAPRIATVLMYLSDVEEGGETAFPLSNDWIDVERVAELGNVSECAAGHLAVKPRKGDALLFFSLTPNGVPDEASLHTGCPVVKGVKWTATIWMHTEPFRPEELDGPVSGMGPDPGKCEDTSDECKRWKDVGECAHTSEYMSVHCARSCGLCRQCADEDQECYRQNRAAKGFPTLEYVA